MSAAEGRRIGGEFELWPRLASDAAPSAGLPTFGAAHETWLDTGRSALAVIAAHLARSAAAATVWLPAYSCESVAAPFKARGLALRFYGVGARLDRLDATPAPGDTLLFIHYFGTRNRTALQRAPALRAAGVRVIEDCVQAALTQGIGRDGDHAVTSLRKLLAQPDGALLASREPLAGALDAPDEAFVNARTLGKILRGSDAAAPSFLPLFEASERRLADDHPRAMSWLSRHLLAQEDLAAIGARRRANFATLAGLLAGLDDAAGVRPLVGSLAEGEVPLGLPITVPARQRDGLRAHLAAAGIFCPVHWDLSHVDADGFEDERALSAALLTLPIDQRYDARDMCAIHDSLATFIGARS